MYSIRSQYIACVLCVCACVVSARVAYGGRGRGVGGDVVNLPVNAEAQAAALTNSAGAAAAAAKIDAANLDALNRYGLEIGVPLLVKPYGPLDNLYAAALPPRSFVGQIDPAFQRDSYGNVKFVSGSSIGVAAI